MHVASHDLFNMKLRTCLDTGLIYDISITLNKEGLYLVIILLELNRPRQLYGSTSFYLHYSQLHSLTRKYTAFINTKKDLPLYQQQGGLFMIVFTLFLIQNSDLFV